MFRVGLARRENCPRKMSEVLGGRQPFFTLFVLLNPDIRCQTDMVAYRGGITETKSKTSLSPACSAGN